MRLHILFADSNHLVRDILVDHLVEAGYRVTKAGSFKDAISKLGDTMYDAIITNDKLGDGTGGKLWRTVRESGSITPVLIISSREKKDIVDADANDIHHLMEDGISREKLLAAVAKLVQSGSSPVFPPARTTPRRGATLRANNDWVLRRDVA